MLLAVILLSRQSQWGIPTAAAYLGLGALGGLILYLCGIERIDLLGGSDRTVERTTEFAVVIALFSTAMKMDRYISWQEWRSPLLLVVVAMPLTILALPGPAGWAIILRLLF